MAASPCQQYNEDALCCPVTFIPFTDPVIIPECGHTFDRESLADYKKRECPTCRTCYQQNPFELPTNWAIVSFLELNIRDKANTPIKYSAKQAKRDKKAYVNANAKVMVNNILQKIPTLAKTGENKLKAKYSDYSTGMDTNSSNKAEILDKVVKLLKKDKYTASYSCTKKKYTIYVSW